MANNGQTAGGFDTLAAARAMEAAGVERRQAESIAMTMRDAVTFGAATKADIGDVRREVAGAKAELKEDIADVRGEVAGLRAELKEDIASVKAEIKEDIADVRREIASHRVELKEDIAGVKTEFKADMARLEVRLVKIIFAVAGGQAAIIVTLLKLLG